MSRWQTTSVCTCRGKRVLIFPRFGPHRHHATWRCTSCGHRELAR